MEVNHSPTVDSPTTEKTIKLLPKSVHANFKTP